MGKFAGLVKFTGRTGDIVGSKGTKGDYITRIHQPIVKNPNTMKQVAQRLRFLTATALSAAIMEADDAGMVGYAKGRRISTRNAMTQMLAKKTNEAIRIDETTPSNPRAEIDYGRVFISYGIGDQVMFGELDLSTEGQVSTTWTGGIANQVVHMVVYNPVANQAVAATPVEGTTGAIVCNVPRIWSGMKVYVYGFTQNMKSEDEAINYISWWSMGSVEAEAQLSATDAEATPSISAYLGTGDIA